LNQDNLLQEIYLELKKNKLLKDEILSLKKILHLQVAVRNSKSPSKK